MFIKINNGLKNKLKFLSQKIINIRFFCKIAFLVNKLRFINNSFFYIFLLFIISCGYLIRLFWPEIKVFFTPDIFVSDLIHLNYSLKYFLATTLKKNTLPYWTWKIDNGFPLISESQIGAFYLPNIILFKFLPFDIAFNIGYVVVFFVSSLGSFLFFELIIKHKILAFFGSLLFTYSAPLFLQITHYNLLQGYSLIPLIFYYTELLNREKFSLKKIKFLIILSIILAQQFFSGYAMVSFITFLFIFLYQLTTMVVYKNFKKKFLTSLSYLFLLLTFFIPQVLCQLIPLIEYTFGSTRATTNSFFSLANSLNPSSLLTYFKFDILGSFPNGTVSLLTGSKMLFGANLWDSNLYLGLFPILFSFFFLPFVMKFKKHKIALILYLISLLLALGKDSPLSFLYGLPPFSLFRTPVRFNIMMTFFLVLFFLLSSKYFFDLLKQNRLKEIIIYIYYILLIITIIDLWRIAQKYHPITKPEKLLKNEIVEYLKKNDPNLFYNNSNTIFSFGTEMVWYQTLLHKNWKKPSIYIFLTKSLFPYTNLIYDLPSSNIFHYSFFSPKNQYFYNQELYNSFFEDIKILKNENFNEPVINYNDFVYKINNTNIELSNKTINLLRIKGVKYLVTPFNLKEKRDKIKKIKEFSWENENNQYYLRIYQLANPYNKFYFPQKIFYINTNEDISRLLNYFIFDNYVFTFEEIPSFQNNIFSNEKINFLKQNDNLIEIYIENSKTGILASSISYSPNLTLYLNNKKTNFFKINHNQLGIKIPAGKQHIKIVFNPSWLKLSLTISLISYAVLIILLIYLTLFSNFFKKSK